MSRTICLYLHAHQPYRIRPYSIFDAGHDHNYWHAPQHHADNQAILQKVAHNSYKPTNAMLLQLLRQHPRFSLSLSITGTLIEQLEQWAPDVLQSFQELVRTGRVEIVAETYYHSLAFFYSRSEFEYQVHKHRQKIRSVFGVEPQVFRNTELGYNNELAQWADSAGYTGVITEGWDPILDWRSPNFMYRPVNTQNIRLLLKNYRLSDDIAFRFGNRAWHEWPLTAHKYAQWINELPQNQPLVNLFMDYETFGEHQWANDGIFDFMHHFTELFLQNSHNRFATISDAIAAIPPVDTISMPHVVTWADSERDLTAWTGNAMQQEAIANLYALEDVILHSDNSSLITNWRRLQTSDHFYYMCTKWFNDGDVHAYFSPYRSPYDACIFFNNVLRDIRARAQGDVA